LSDWGWLLLSLNISWKNNRKENKLNNINILFNIMTDTAMVRFGAFNINGEKQKFHPSGESIRPAILRRFWGRHITYIAFPTSP
jgi:hypothetical protein